MRKGRDEYTRDARLFYDGVQGMTPELAGVYNTLVDLIYLRDGETERDDRALAGHLHSSTRKIRALTEQLINCGKLEFDGVYLRNKKATLILQKNRFRASSARQSRKKIAEKKADSRKNNDLGGEYVFCGADSRGGATRTRERDINQITNLRDTPPPTPPRENFDPNIARPWITKIDPNFQLDEDGKKFALDRGIIFSDLENQVERFKTHHQAKGTVKQDWNAAWRLWVTDPIRKRENGKAKPRNRTDPESFLKAARAAMPGDE